MQHRGADSGFQAPSDLQPHYGNGGFNNVYLLDLDNTKSSTLLAPHCYVVDMLGL